MKNLFPLSLLKSLKSIHLKIHIHPLFLSQLNRACSLILSLWPLSLWFIINPEITFIRSFPRASDLYGLWGFFLFVVVWLLCLFCFVFNLEAEVKWSELWNSDPEEKIPNLLYLKNKPLLMKLNVRTREMWTNNKLHKLQALCAADENMALFSVSFEVFQNLMQKRA